MAVKGNGLVELYVNHEMTIEIIYRVFTIGQLSIPYLPCQFAGKIFHTNNGDTTEKYFTGYWYCNKKLHK